MALTRLSKVHNLVDICIFLIYASLLITINCQKLCQTQELPPVIPISIDEQISIDLNDYLQGPNMSIKLNNSSFQSRLDNTIQLSQKYQQFQSIEHNLGRIHSVSLSPKKSLLTMLGQSVISVNKKYYIYLSQSKNIVESTVKSIDVPVNMGDCTAHRVNKQGSMVVVLGQKLQEKQNITRLLFTVGILNITSEEWDVTVQPSYFVPRNRRPQFLGNYKIVIAVEHPENSYIELWDIKYGHIINVYDRVFFNLQIFNIMDINTVDNKIYILERTLGIYQMYLKFDQLIIQASIAFSFYEQLAVTKNGIILAKNGTMVDIQGAKTIKYNNFPGDYIYELQVSLDFILVYTSNSQLFIYKRGVREPYVILDFKQYWGVLGIFTGEHQFIQIFSQFNKEGEITPGVILRKIGLSSPILKIGPYPANKIDQKYEVNLNGNIKINEETDSCNIKFEVLVTKIQNQQIYERIHMHQSTERIYLNMPGRAQLPLQQYGIGSNIEYKVETFQSNLNLSTSIQKISPLVEFSIPQLNFMKISQTFTTKQCQSLQCPLVIDSTQQNLIKYYKCNILSNFYTKYGLTCVENYRQFKFLEFSHFQLQQKKSSTIYQFTEISVYENQRNKFQIRQFYEADSKLANYILLRYQVEENNTYGQNNITQIKYIIERNIVIVLLAEIKQLRVYKIEQTLGIVTVNLQKSITVSNLIMMSQSQQSIYFKPEYFELDNENMLWVKSLDQILVINYSNQELGEKSQILNVIKVRIPKQKTWQYSFKLITRTSTAKTLTTQEIKQYLVIYAGPNILQFCGIGHSYECLYGFKNLPLYKMLIAQSINPIADNLGESKLSILLKQQHSSVSKVQIYNLQAFSSSLSPYLKTTQIPTQLNSTCFQSYFHSITPNPLLLIFCPQISSSMTVAASYSIVLSPSVTIFLPLKSSSKTNSENIILDVFNQQYLIRHTLLIGVSNYPQILTKGNLYPYVKLRTDVRQEYIEIDTVGWFLGNVLQFTYTCSICQDFISMQNQDKQINEGMGLINVRHKLWKKHTVSILNADSIQAIGPNEQRIAIIKNNLIYLLNMNTGNISTSFQISLDPSDTIEYTILNPQYGLGAGLLMRAEGRFGLIIFSINSFKTFIVSEQFLSQSIRYVYSMAYVNKLIAVTDYEGVSLFTVSKSGQSRQVYYIDEDQAGGDICWAELLAYESTMENNGYVLIVTLCKEGISVFNIVASESDIRILKKQSIDLSAALKLQNIRLPTDASFRRTLTTLNSDGFSLIALINNFNSFRFQLSAQPMQVITNIKIVMMIHRYADFTMTQQVSLEPISNRYLKILYHGLIYNSPRYIIAVYDLYDTYKAKDQEYQNCYIMEAVISQNQVMGKFVASQMMVLLESNTHNSIVSVYNVSNCFRAFVHDAEKVYSQSLFIIPNTPTSSLSIEIFLQGIDIVEWKTWQIFLLILLIAFTLIVLGFAFRVGLNQYRRRRKLVPLLVDYPQYDQDIEQETEGRSINGTYHPQKIQTKFKEEDKEAQQQISEKQQKQDDAEEDNKYRINDSVRGSTTM